MWHVSVSWQTPQGPVPLDRLRFEQQRRMLRVIEATLRSVGEGDAFPYDAHLTEITIQRRKLLSPAEVAALPQRLLPDRWIGHGELE